MHIVQNHSLNRSLLRKQLGMLVKFGMFNICYHASRRLEDRDITLRQVRKAVIEGNYLRPKKHESKKDNYILVIDNYMKSQKKELRVVISFKDNGSTFTDFNLVSAYFKVNRKAC